jgi:hypothetical protein
MATSDVAIRTPLIAGAGFAAATIISAIVSLTLFILHLNQREPLIFDSVAASILSALIGFLGAAWLFRSLVDGLPFGAAFLIFPLLARTLYEMGRMIPYANAALDLLISFYFAILIPALATGLIGALAVWLMPRYRYAALKALGVFAIAGAIGGGAAPLISWLLAQMAAESAIAATLSIYGEELVRFSLAGAGLAWTLRRAARPTA